MGDEGAVTVCVRVRPLIARENALEDKASVQWKSENNTISEVNGTKVFTYDRVFHSNDNTQQLYEGVAVPIIESAVQGYNGTIFAYGQTASGKTYTMMGNEDSVGIIPKAIQHVFKVICEIPEREFLLRVSYMEIYNETITDLLCDIRKKKPLGIREDVNRNTYVEDLIEEVVVSPEQVMQWIRKGEKNRHYGETKMNEHSSRSHTIFRMIIESRERSDPANANCDGAVMVSHLNLVDLAGSERASQTGSEGVRLKEGCNINRSLFILGQVIKKLCDDPSGFINYRDSKLTRILQNSLGGNAKTVIICTITPVSFDETLSTLQFANTAKRMKNTPIVNEVLDDDALLKRYRKEILDLKKQLEEVSSKTQIHAMEKDQLAQLLEEKNSLQKVQEDRIRNLTEMLVTSASFSSKQNFKAKRRRRVTWAPGKINQANESYFEDFEKPGLTETKKMKMSLLSLPDIEDSMLENCEQDNQCLMVPDQISEVEWTAGPNMNWTQRDFEESVQLCEALALEKDIAVNEINTLQANFNNLVLENEQLKLEINEMKEKLKEKIEMDEFEALEKQTQKDHEEQLMHEITNLKNLVSNAEVYNEELEVEINSKLEQLKEKENKIKILQNRVEELQKAAAKRKDTSFSVGDSDKLIEEIQQLNKSLLDSETIALDAKKESAFLRTENLELKEKMNELLNNHKQMQKDVQLYQSQIEAGKASYKKMQAELQKELQSVFQENTRLTSLMEGKVPKDLLSVVELEKKATDLKGDLEKALKENAILQKQVNELSELQSLPNTVEIQQKEILEKCEELRLLKLEREKLLSEVADNEVRLKHMTEEIGKSKDDLADAQLKYVKSDQEYAALKQLHEELEQKYVATLENNEQMKIQIDILSKEAQESRTTLDEVKLELSGKMKELEEKTAEHQQLLEVREDFIQAQQKLNEMEQLKEHEKIIESRLEAKDSEIQAVVQQLTECREEIKALTQERDYLKQKEESLQAETDQLKEDIKDTVSMNILAHEELRNAQSSLKQSQDTVKKLEKNISEKESEILRVEEALGKTIKDLEIQISQMTEEIKIITSERDQLAEEKAENTCEESDQLQALKEQIFSLMQENNSLQDKLDNLHLKKEEYGEGTSIPQIQEKSIEQELFLLREELSQAQRKLHEMEEAKANECQRESEKTGTTDHIPKLHDHQDVSALTEAEKDNLKMQLENLQNQRDRLRETVQEATSKNSEMQEELTCAHNSLRQHQETIAELKGGISEKEDQLLKAQEALKETTDELQRKLTEVTENLTRVSSEYAKLLTEKEEIERSMNENIHQQLEQITLLNQEKDELQRVVETCKAERDQLEAECLESKEKVVKLNEDLNLVTQERHQLLGELEKTEGESSKLPQLQEQCDLLVRERDQLQEMLEGVRAEKNQLEINLQESADKILETEKELKRQEELLSNEKAKAEEREEHLLKVQRQSEILEDNLTNQIQQLTETLNSVSCEKDQLLAERTSHSFQLQEQILSINQEKDELQQHLQDVKSERDQLKTELQKISKMCVEANAKLENALDQLKQRSLTKMSNQVNPLDNAEQMVDGSLEENTLKIKLTEVTENLTRVSSEYAKLLTEKEEIERSMNENIHQQLEKITLLNQEKDELQRVVETCKAERDQLEAECLESKEKSLKVLTEMENLQEELKHQKEQVDIQKNLLANGEKILRNTEGKLNEEINKLQEKVVKLNEDLNLVTQERHQLLGDLKKTEGESSKLPQLQEQCDLLVRERDQLQEMLEGVRAEKNQLEINLQESADKIQQLTETLNSVSCEKDQLLAERTTHSFQLKEQILSINQEKDELQQHLQDVKSERDQLRTELQKKSEMCAEANAKLESALDQLKQRSLTKMSIQVNPLDNAEQMVDGSLEENTLKIKELLERFLDIGKRYECLSTVSLDLKNELNSQKALIAVILAQLSSQESKQVQRLQTENEKINGHLQSLLNKLKFLFSRVCLKKREYYTTVNKYEMELLEEKRKQDQLRAQIQFIRKTYLNQNETSSQELNTSEWLQSLHLDAESILKDISEMESELLSIEAELQQEESARKETARFWEGCSGTLCDAEEIKEELKKDNERLLQVIKFWTPKVKILLQLSSELDARTASYCKNADGESEQRKEKSKELLQELNSLKEQLAPGGSASLALEEEHYRLRSKLKAAEQDIKAMEGKIQELENVINEVRKNVKEKDDKINKLQAQIRMKTDTKELSQLQEKLNATEKHLGTSLAENQRLQAKLDKGAELYKEEIDNLKTQLVKHDMERMKQSKSFDTQLANYKAVAEHKEQQLRKLKEELRRAQQDHDVTVLEKEAPRQPQMALTCGGGSGIVQSTQILVLKSEQAKLQKENLHLKKQNDLLLSNELQLKGELSKWKERALKWKERSSREITRDAVPRSPRKTVPYSLKEQMPSPSKEPVSQETVAQNISQPLPLTCPTNLFDNSSLDLQTDIQPAGAEPKEQLKHWFGTSEKDKAPDCVTQ